jgi:uncharacterized protein
LLIGLISDTHIPEVEKHLPPEVIQAFQGVDLILHAGDIYSPSVLDELERVAPVLAAAGDDDSGETLKDPRVKEKQIFKLSGYTIWLVHMRPYHIATPWWRNQHPAGKSNGEDAPDIVIFGHEHTTVVEELHNVLYINSGSPTFLHYQRGLGTAGILELQDHQREARIFDLSSPG